MIPVLDLAFPLAECVDPDLHIEQLQLVTPTEEDIQTAAIAAYYFGQAC